MKKLPTIAIATVLLGLSSAALAKSHICTTADPHTSYVKLNTEFTCTEMPDYMTMVTINKKGYRVVSITVHHTNSGAEWAIVIEK